MRCAAVLLALAACGGDDTPVQIDAAPAADASPIDAAPPRELIMETRPLQPGEIIEGIMTGGPNDLALIHLEAPAMEIDWNIHSHPGNGSAVVVYEERNRMVVDYAFVPSQQEDWYLLIKNSGPTSMDVIVRVGLYGDMAWRWE